MFLRKKKNQDAGDNVKIIIGIVGIIFAVLLLMYTLNILIGYIVQQ